MATILLVDDRPINRQFLTTLLGYGGHHLLQASDGAEALSIILAQRPDLIITDILMPTMNGFELVRRLRQDPNLADLEVIFYTATYRTSEARLLADACGVKHVLAKPSEPQIILETVNAVLGGKGSGLKRPVENTLVEQLPIESGQEAFEYVRNKLPDFLKDLQSVNTQLVSLIGRGTELVLERDRFLHLSDEFAKNLADFQSVNLKFVALNEFSFNLTSERNPERMLEMLCDASRRIVGASYVVVHLLDVKEETAKNVYGSGDQSATRVPEEVIDKVISMNRPVRHGTFMGVPLGSLIQIYGLVIFHSKANGEEFSREDEQLAVTLASEAAVAYENARLYDMVQRHAAKLQLEIEERKRAEAALAASEQRFRALVENAPDGIALLDIDGKLRQLTPSTERILGYTTSEALNQDPAILTHPQDLPDLLMVLNDLIQNPGKVVRTEYRFQHKDGSWRWLESTISNLIAEPSVQALVFNYRDITEPKRAEEALRERDALLNRSQAMAHVGSWVLESKSNRLTWSDEVYRIFGQGKREFPATYEAFLQAVHPDDRTAVDEAYSRSVREGHHTYEIEHRIIRPESDEVRFVHEKCEHVRDSRGQIVRSIGMVQDITERKQTEEALRNSQMQLSGIFNSAMDAIISTDANEYILIFNPAAEAIFRCQRAEAIGQPLERFIPDRFRVSHKAHLHNFAQTGVTNRSMGHLGTIHGLRSDGEEFPIEASISKIEVAGQAMFTVILRDITERKRAEEALSQNEKRFRALTENISDVIAMIDQDGLITYASPGITRVLGYAVDETVGQNEFGLIHPDDLEMAKQNLRGVLEGQGSSASFVVRERHKDGAWRWVEGVGTNLLEEPGVNGIVVNFRDITERVEAEEKIKRQFQRLSALRTIDMAISTSFDMNLSLTVLVNQTLTQLGASAADILLHNPDTLTLDYAVGKGFTSSAIQQTHLRFGEGLAGRTAVQRRKTLVVNLAETDEQNMRGELLKEEAFVSYYATPLLAKGELKGVLEIFNRTELCPNQEWLDFVETLAGQAAIAIDNSTLFLNLQRANAELEHRVEQRTAELHQLNDELQHANRAKDEFLATMSHELRTPLNSILGLSESLLEGTRGPLNKRQREYLKVVESSGQHLLQLINDVLDLSKIEAGKFDYFPQMVILESLCHSSLAFVREQAARKSIQLVYEQTPVVSEMRADPRRLKQMLVNLLTNAVKFTLDGGRITLRVHADQDKDLVQFSVIDTGIGIAPDDLKKLFRPFVQLDSNLNRQYEGTGLGLALVQKMADLHGGSVEVESEVGKGSRFTINLRWKNEPEAVSQISAIGLKGDASTQTSVSGAAIQSAVERRVVLLVEDNNANILTVSEYLESYGNEVVVAHDGWEALAKAEEKTPDIILMDIQMPAMDGLEATRRLRADPRFVATPIIALTALAMPGDRERCLEAGATEYMSKPVSLKLLMKTIRQLLAQEEQNT